MKKTVFIAMLLISVSCVAQKTSQKLTDLLPKRHGKLFFFGDNGKILENDSNAFWVYELIKTKTGYKYFVYYKNNYAGKNWAKQPRETRIEETKRNFFEFSTKSSHQIDISYREIIDSINNIYFYQEYDENYKIVSYGKTKNKFILQKEDTCFVYYENGQMRAENYYKNGEMLGNKNWNEDGTEDISDIFTPYDTVPEYPGGEIALRKYIAENTIYPMDARRNGVTGKVFVRLIIMEDGSIDGVKVVRKVASELDEEAIRVVKSLKNWKPGKINGKNVRSGYTIPINFRLK